LALYALAIEASKPLQQTFGIVPSGISFHAAACISIMLDTKRKGLLSFLGDVISDDRGHRQAVPAVHPQPIGINKPSTTAATLSRNKPRRFVTGRHP
jgi:hypothetical protein